MGKGILHTLEAVLATLIILGFILIVSPTLPKDTSSAYLSRDKAYYAFQALEKNQKLEEYAFDEDLNSLNTSMGKLLPGWMLFSVALSNINQSIPVKNNDYNFTIVDSSSVDYKEIRLDARIGENFSNVIEDLLVLNNTVALEVSRTTDLLNITTSPNTITEENWWNSSWEYRQTITITNNNDTTVLESGYNINFTFDHLSLVSSGKSLANGNDVRVVWYNSGSYTELDRENTSAFNLESTTIWFKLQEDIDADGSSSDYYLYYDYSSAGTPTEYYVSYDIMPPLSLGEDSVCILNASGNALCWGDGSDGEIGDDGEGATTNTPDVPVLVDSVEGAITPLGDVIGVQASYRVAGSLLRNGTVRCYGKGTTGAMGTGVGSSNTYANKEVIIDNVTKAPLTNVIQFAGSDQTNFCAVLSNGTARCWGYEGINGKFGVGTTNVNKFWPDESVWAGSNGGELQNVAFIGGYDSNTCALLNNGTVKCWGDASQGTLGYRNWGEVDWENPTSPQTTPTEYVANDSNGGVLQNVVQIGYNACWAICALINDGTVRCWGDAGSGNLGDNTTVDKSYPVIVGAGTDVGTLTNIVDIDVGCSHSCALNSTGNVLCWGSNSKGNLGDNQTCGTACGYPVTVWSDSYGGALSNIVDIDVGYRFSCALNSTGSVLCWGEDSNGKLGDNLFGGVAKHTPRWWIDVEGEMQLKESVWAQPYTGSYHGTLNIGGRLITTNRDIATTVPDLENDIYMIVENYIDPVPTTSLEGEEYSTEPSSTSLNVSVYSSHPYKIKIKKFKRLDPLPSDKEIVTTSYIIAGMKSILIPTEFIVYIWR